MGVLCLLVRGAQTAARFPHPVCPQRSGAVAANEMGRAPCWRSASGARARPKQHRRWNRRRREVLWKVVSGSVRGRGAV